MMIYRRMMEPSPAMRYNVPATLGRGAHGDTE